MASPESTGAVADYEVHLRQEVEALQAEHGDAYLQKLLQQDIATCKKKDSELSALKSKVKAVAEDVDRLQEAVRKTKLVREKSEVACHALEETMRKREQLTASMTTEMAAHRDSSRGRIEEHLEQVRQGIKEREEKLAVIEAENEELDKTLIACKDKFEDFYNKFQDSMKDRTSSFQTLLADCQVTAKELEVVQTRLILVRRQRHATDVKTATLREQLALNETQFESFAKSTLRPEDVAAVTSQQREQAAKRVAQLEQEKEEANTVRQECDKETMELRARLASLKKDVQQAERAKVAAEKKCRQAQEMLKQRS